MIQPQKLIEDKLKELGYEGKFDILMPPDQFGDYSTNVAFVLKKNPDVIKSILEKDEDIKKIFSKIEVAKNGFVNFFLSEYFLHNALIEIIKDGNTYGNSNLGDKEKINLEFVSANPTGPLTIGNARGGIFGDILGNVLNKTGHKVHKEYYINDTGNQVRILGESVARRYLQLKGIGIDFPEDNYQGEYVTDLAREMADKKVYHGDEKNFEELSLAAQDFALATIIGWIKESLVKVGVRFDTWFSEKTLHETEKIHNALNVLKIADLVYEKDGAIWMKTDEENDAVLIKNDNTPTYLLGDLAYSQDKFNRSFNRMINIWGSDHHGDVHRIIHGLTVGMGYDPKKVEILLYQHVTLKDAGKISKRKGQFITLDELTNEVGSDAVRFFFAGKSLDTHMEFDLDLAKEQSSKNPVFYIQYANARINSLFKKGSELNLEPKLDRVDLLKEKEELNLIKHMIRLPYLLEQMTRKREIHQLTNYVSDLASLFHSFYEKHRIAGEEKNLAEARLGLIYGVQSVLNVTAGLLGVSLPDRM